MLTSLRLPTLLLNLPSIRSADVLKGIAILAIIGHNFYHHLPPVMGENEFLFQEGLYQEYLRSLAAHPERIVRYILSYFGHSGVQLFIFLTAYGYGRKSILGVQTSLAYFLRRFVGVYIAFMIAVGAYLLLLALATLGGATIQSISYLDILYRVTLVSNFVPNQALEVVGPWWYVSFLLQIMLCLPLILVLYARFGRAFAVVWIPLFIVMEWLVGPQIVELGLNINHTVLGHMPLLIFGVAFAHGDFRRFSALSFGVLFAVLVLSNYYLAAWLVYDIALVLTVLLVQQYVVVRIEIPEVFCNTLAYLGSISLYLFLVNGFLRFPFRKLAIAVDSALFEFVLVIGLIFVSVAAGLVIMRVERIVYTNVKRLVTGLSGGAHG